MAGPSVPSYVREFTRHSSDVLTNLNELRQRRMLTDVTLRVGGCPWQAHKAVLTACSGFFYSVFLGQGGREVTVLTLPSSIEPVGFQALLDFMYTSRLLLSPGTAPSVLVAASYLQMEHVVQSCHRFLQASYDQLTLLMPPQGPQALPEMSRPLDDGPSLHRGVVVAPIFRGATIEKAPPSASSQPPGKDPTAVRSPGAGDLFPGGPPSSPGESSGCVPIPEPQMGNWKKQRFIVLHPALPPPEGHPSGEPGRSGCSGEGGPAPRSPPADPQCSVCNPGPTAFPSQPPKRLSAQRGGGCSPGSRSSSCQACDLQDLPEEEEVEGGSTGPKVKAYKHHLCSSASRCQGTPASHRALHTGEKPYHCGICGARFNRPANLKTHLRIHSGEKPYKCEMCGSRFVQVAHLRAHVLIHTGEKPYPCGTCGTRFRHLQTLKSHLRIHTGEKPYHCEECRVRFRHKSQLRLHLRQKHGAVTNTKIRYPVLDGSYAIVC